MRPNSSSAVRSALFLMVGSAAVFACGNDPTVGGDGDGGTSSGGDGDAQGSGGSGDDIIIGDGDIDPRPNGEGVCGDGILSDTEACDDGNTEAGDGCAAECTSLEPGYTCPQPGRPCQPFARCGDGVVSFPESCDDGNTTPDDGCSSNCKEEIGYRCDGEPSTCSTTTCGDGRKEGSEACEHHPATTVDGQPIPGNGCGVDCQIEPDCSGDSCTSTCGDGLRIDEACDDGNTLDGDGCSSTCEIEEGYTCESSCTIYDPDGDGEGPCFLEVPAVFRDFNVSFEDISNGCSGLVTDMVESSLDTNGKPVLSAAGISGSCISSQASFAKWYTDAAPENATKVGSIRLFDNGAGGFVNRFGNNGDGLTPDQFTNGATSYDGNPLFFPVDDGINTLTPMTDYEGAQIPGSYGGGGGGTHNFHFTTEVQYWFTYSDEMDATLSFEGDDDVWVFIKDQLVVDIGGIHNPEAGSVRLFGGEVISSSEGTVTASSMGLFDGGVYEIKVFQAERNVVGSSFKLTLAGFDRGRSECTPNCGDGIIGAGEECDDGENDGGYNECQPGCVLGGYCGDGIVQDGETCDDGDPDKPAGCSGCRILLVR